MSERSNVLAFPGCDAPTFGPRHAPAEPRTAQQVRAVEQRVHQPSERHREHVAGIYDEQGWTAEPLSDDELLARTARCGWCGTPPGPTSKCFTTVRGRRRELDVSHDNRLRRAREQVTGAS